MKRRRVRGDQIPKAKDERSEDVSARRRLDFDDNNRVTQSLVSSSESTEDEGNACKQGSSVTDSSPTLQEILGDMLCDNCQIHRVTNLKIGALMKPVLKEYERLLEAALLQSHQGGKHCYIYRVTFQVVEGGSLNEFKLKALYFYVECKPDKGLFEVDSVGRTAKEFQAVYHGLLASAEGFKPAGKKREDVSLLLSGGSRPIRRLMKVVLPRILGCFVDKARTMAGRDLQAISGSYLVSCAREKSVDLKGVMSVKVPSKWVDSHCCSIECVIPLVYFRSILQEIAPVQQSLTSASYRLWYEFFQLMKSPLPISLNSQYAEISFPGFRIIREGKIQVMNPSAEGSLVLLASIVGVLWGPL